jgi:hypothetical protein
VLLLLLLLFVVGCCVFAAVAVGDVSPLICLEFKARFSLEVAAKQRRVGAGAPTVLMASIGRTARECRIKPYTPTVAVALDVTRRNMMYTIYLAHNLISKNKLGKQIEYQLNIYSTPVMLASVTLY